MRRIHEAPDCWVPEDHIYKTAEDCIAAHPEEAAAGLFKEGCTGGVTLDDLKRARDEMNRASVPSIEVYPLAFKKDPQMKKLCDERVESGFGVWEQKLNNTMRGE